MIHPAGDGAQQPKSLRLCTFAALRWFNWPFITQNPKNHPLFKNIIRCTNRTGCAQIIGSKPRES
jgi:hypothetical protein